jgi:hypothetical protein
VLDDSAVGPAVIISVLMGTFQAATSPAMASAAQHLWLLTAFRLERDVPHGGDGAGTRAVPAQKAQAMTAVEEAYLAALEVGRAPEAILGAALSAFRRGADTHTSDVDADADADADAGGDGGGCSSSSSLTSTTSREDGGSIELLHGVELRLLAFLHRRPVHPPAWAVLLVTRARRGAAEGELEYARAGGRRACVVCASASASASASPAGGFDFDWSLSSEALVTTYFPARLPVPGVDSYFGGGGGGGVAGGQQWDALSERFAVAAAAEVHGGESDIDGNCNGEGEGEGKGEGKGEGEAMEGPVGLPARASPGSPPAMVAAAAAAAAAAVADARMRGVVHPEMERVARERVMFAIHMLPGDQSLWALLVSLKGQA